MAEHSEAGLRQVREDDLDALKDRLARHLPHSSAVYNAVSLAARYSLHSLQPASILVPACPHPSCFTVISPVTSSVRVKQCLLVFWSLEEHTAKDVARHLSYIPDLDWSQPVTIRTLPTILLPSLQSLGSVGRQRVRHRSQVPGHLYNLQAPVLVDPQLPPVYHVTRLRGEDVSTIWTDWKFNHFDSEDNVKHDITHFPSVGIRERGSLQEEGEETLVSWTRTTKVGWIGNTFTLPQHRRRGLASVATVALARKLLQEGLLAFVNIEDINTASIKFHESLGFKRQCPSVTAIMLPAEATDRDHL